MERAGVATDWIVIGGGIAGAALGYELARAGFSVRMFERAGISQNATRYSYGGISYWSATTDLMRQICQEGIELHRGLSAELGADTLFRELDLLLTIAPEVDPSAIATSYQSCLVPPRLISADAAVDMEPLLDRGAIGGALHAHHGHVDPEAMVNAYLQAMQRLGGVVERSEVTGFVTVGDRLTGVTAASQSYSAAHVVVCAGGLSRALLQKAGINVPCYFTQAELVETPPVDVRLQTIVMPADLKRFELEAIAGQAEYDALWDVPGHEIAPPILDAGVIQLVDGRLRMGQISRVLTDPHPIIDAAQSEQDIRAGVGQLLPKLQQMPGQWFSCLVAFSGDRLPLVGAIPDCPGAYIFSGFSNPFAILPPLARRFAGSLAGHADPIIPQLSPERFLSHKQQGQG